MVKAANEGFMGGRVTKHDLLSWLILYFEKQGFANLVEKVRVDHFDQVTYLESVLKQAKRARREGVTAPDLSEALEPILKNQRSKPSRTRASQVPLQFSETGSTVS